MADNSPCRFADDGRQAVMISPFSPDEAMTNIRKMYLFRFLSCMHLFAGVLIPFFTEWGGASFWQVMLLQSWFVLWISLLEAPTGAVADSYGRKTSLLCGAAALTAAVLLYSWRPDIRLFFLAEFLWAVAGAFLSGADDAIIYDTLKSAGRENLSKACLGRLSGFEMAAIMVSAPLGSLIAARWGLRAPTLCMAVPFAAAFMVGITLREPPDDRDGKPRSGYAATLLAGFRVFWGHPALRALAFESVTIFPLCFMMVWLFQPLLSNLGVPIAAYGFVTAGGCLLQVLILNNLARMERLFGGKRRYLAASAVIPGLAFLALTRTRQPFAAALLVVAVMGFGLSRNALISNYLNKHIESRLRATVLSTVSMLRQLFSAALYPAVGLLVERSIPATLAVLGLGVLACGGLSRVQERHLRD